MWGFHDYYIRWLTDPGWNVEIFNLQAPVSGNIHALFTSLRRDLSK